MLKKDHDAVDDHDEDIESSLFRIEPFDMMPENVSLLAT